MEKVKASIIGASGLTGGELIKFLVRHTNVDITHITSTSKKGEKVDNIHKNLKTGNVFEEFNSDKISEDSDVAFITQPHSESMKIVKELINKNKDIKIIDIGADFRLKDKDAFMKWYGTDHIIPELLDNFIYGLTELNREKIKIAKYTATPGCYATCIILGLHPLINEGIVGKEDIVYIDSFTGVSGAGLKYKNGKNHFMDDAENIITYNAGEHRHIPEIEQEFIQQSGYSPKMLFIPHIVPVIRGILSMIFVKNNMNKTIQELLDIYKKYYGNEKFIKVCDDYQDVQIKYVNNSNNCYIGLICDEKTGSITIFSCLDNLVKGAVGQAVQNMNVMFGIDEISGLL